MALYASPDEMAAAAIEVLRRNDLGGWTKGMRRDIYARTVHVALAPE